MPAAPSSATVRTTLLSSPIAYGAVDAETGRIPLPERLLIAPWGESKDLDGRPVIVDEHTATVLAANQAAIGRSEVALDFEHNTFQPRTEPQPVAGYGSLEVVTGEGIYYLPSADAWTPDGLSSYQAKHYRDLSPTVIRDESDRVVALHSVALTRAGQIEGLRAYTLSAASLEALATRLAAPGTGSGDKFRRILCKLLGQPEDCTDEELIAAVEKREPAKTESDPTPMSAASQAESQETKPAAPAVPTGEPAPLSAEQRLDLLERRQLLAEAKAAGKIIPLSAEACDKLPLEHLRTVIDGLAAEQVPLQGKTTDKPGDPPKVDALSAEESEVCRRLGLTEEAYRKANPTAAA